MQATGKSYISTLNRISKAITSDIYLEDMLKLVVNLTANVMEAKICALWLLDRDKNCLKIRATQALSEEYLKERAIAYGEGIVGLVAKKKEPMVIESVVRDDRYKEKDLAQREGLVSMLSVPMLVKDEAIGVINVYTVKEHVFTRTDIDLLGTIANQSAVAIENTELMVRTKVIEEELHMRKKLEKAKGIIMRKKGLTEEEAYNVLRKTSMDRRVSMKEISEAIILSDQLS